MLGLFQYGVKNLIIKQKQKYILKEGKFSKNYKMPFEDCIYYIIGNTGKTTVLELYNYFKTKYGNFTECVEMTVSKQNFSKQRSYIDPLFFKDANKLSIKDIYSSEEDSLEKFRDYYVFAYDGSQGQLPNTSQTRKEFNIDLNSLKKSKTLKARISVMSDVKNEFIIDSEIAPLSIGEHALAYNHIEKANEIIDLTKAINIFDRYYASMELILQLLSKESYFIFRLKKDTYKKERNKMKSDDEWVNINLNAPRRQNIQNKELKAMAKELGSLNLRIVNVTLKTGKIESLLTNLPDNVTPNELKDLYGERWKIEEGYDVLKNKLHIENFSGKRKITIEQDFYSQILAYNMLMGYKITYNKELKEKHKKEKCEYEYKVNINILAGQLKSNLYKMFLATTEDEINMINEEITFIAKKNLIKVENKPPNPRNKNPLASRYPYNNRKNF